MSPTATHTLDTRKARLQRLVDQRLSALKFSWLRIIQVCVAAGIAYLIASRLLGHTGAFFAPVAVVLTLGLAIERRGKRAYEVAVGVAVGIAAADLIVRLLGTGTWQLVLVLGVAMSAAVLAGGGVMLVNQAAISAVLVASLPVPDFAHSLDRFLDALLGGGIALIANAITPVNPVRLVLRHLDPLLSRLTGTLVDIADALDNQSHEEITAALERARALDPAVREMQIAVQASRETTYLAPLRKGTKGRVRQLADASDPIDLIVRNTRVLARSARRAIDLEEHVPPLVTDGIRDLATAVNSFDLHLAGVPRRSATKDSALRASARASAALEQTSNMSVSAIVAQVRSASTDLLLGIGMTRDEAIQEVRSAREKMDI